MSESTLEIQLNPPLASVMAHLSYDASPWVDEFGDVHGDWDERASNKDGHIGFQKVENGRACYVLLQHADYDDELIGSLTLPHDKVFITLRRSRNGKEHGQLHVEGRDFYTSDGRPWHFRGYTMHYLINQMWNGADLDRVLDEPIELGANVLISIGLHCSPWKTANGWRCTPLEHPDYFEQLGRLFDRCAERRIRIAHAPLADVQFYPGDIQLFWLRSCAVMRGRWNVIARKGNESAHNGWNEHDFRYPNMQGVLTSQGSKGGEANPVEPYLDFCEFELRRDIPKMFVDAPLRQLMDGDFPGLATRRPTVSIEPIFFHHMNQDHVGDQRCTDPRVALELGVLTGLCAGGGFGASDGLDCQRLQPVARQCAEEYFRGMTAGFQRPLLGD